MDKSQRTKLIIEMSLDEIQSLTEQISSGTESTNKPYTEDAPLSRAYLEIYHSNHMIALAIKFQLITVTQATAFQKRFEGLIAGFNQKVSESYSVDEQNSLLINDFDRCLKSYEEYITDIAFWSTRYEESIDIASSRDVLEAWIHVLACRFNLSSRLVKLQELDSLLRSGGEPGHFDYLCQKEQERLLIPESHWWWYKEGYHRKS